ncbi:MAG: Glyoxalase/Bleomycin resistance protein/Dioxygenase superfamily [Noviherbaspirillum sp.]|jgi:extradiol dioxygenase|nr:Glyoxalase/Bleomycin resistance protein/Dioxygenase superfamily [Noviherbaspirillum sp.]
MNSVSALGYIGIESNAVDRWQEFATTVLGMRQSGHAGADQAAAFAMDEHSYRLAIRAGDGEGLAYLGLEVANDAVLKNLFNKLASAGTEPSWASAEDCRSRDVLGLARVLDPAGNVLELYYGMKRICQPFQSPRPISGFVTGPLGMGHVVIAVPDLNRCLQFYTEVLGFRISDYFFDKVVFLRCNQRHHSIALANFGSKPGLRHFMVEARTLDDLGMTYDLCQKKPVPIEMTLGKHSNDLMYSFYIQSPSGFEVEYGWNGRLVDESSWTVGAIDRPSVWGHQAIGENKHQRLTSPTR